VNHSTYFPKFLSDEVNIDQPRLDQLKKRVAQVYTALRSDETLGPLVLGNIPQGSWPHRTIIRPRSGGEFDADFLLKLEWADDWAESPRAYSNAVYAALGRHSVYGNMDTGRRARSVYVKYAPVNSIGCHLDVVPFIEHPVFGTVIVNRDAKEDEGESPWEPTCPEGFTDWIEDMDDATNGNFRKVVRLMKYYKVHRGSFNGVKSVVLTTLLGNQVDALATAFDPSRYPDIPRTLVELVTALDVYLQANETKPTLLNPGGDGTNFDHRWTQETYSNFRNRISTVAAAMKAAAAETDHDKSVAAWQGIFGDGFKPGGSSRSALISFPLSTPAPLGAVSGRSGKSG
jgi:hypothetical protein